LDINFKEKYKKFDLPKYSFLLKDVILIFKETYDISKEDSLLICEKMKENGWIEIVLYENDKKMKDISRNIYKLVIFLYDFGILF
jgi:hypothetical protein